MKKEVLLCIGMVLFSLSNHAQTTMRALFLGNSYTYSNNMPQIVADLAKSVGDSLYYDSYAPGGFTLLEHGASSISRGKIMLGNWNYVVLQEQSQLPALLDYSPTADNLVYLTRQYNPCAREMFYMTWGRKNGDALNCPSWPPVCTYSGMDSLLRLRYIEMAALYHSEISPVGAVWRYIRQNNPGINLYLPDESHPTPEGSYLAACSFYTAIFKKDPTLLSYNFTINPANAAIIRAAAKHIVYDSLAKWSYVDSFPEANFGYTIGTGHNQVLFSNHSVYADSYHWDFGDGTTSTLFSPNHSYTNDGTYVVTLTASNCDLFSIYKRTDQATITFCPFTPTIDPNYLLLCPNSTDTLWTQMYNSYQWLNQIGDTIPNAKNRYLVPGGGQYSVLATQNNCTELSVPVNVDMYFVNSIYYLFEGGNPDLPTGRTVCEGDTVLLYIMPNKPPFPDDSIIEWLKDGQPVPLPRNDSLFVTVSGTYGVRIPSSFCPGVLDYESDTITFTFEDCSSGLAEVPADYLQVYPNPSAGFVTIVAPASFSGQEYTLFDQFGRSVGSGKLKASANTLDIGALSAGVYLFRSNGMSVRIVKTGDE